MNRLFFAVIAASACGGATTQTSSSSPAGADMTVGPTGTTTPLTNAPPGEMKSPTATAYANELQAIGLDPQHLPPLNKIAPEQLRKVMPLVAKSLGVKCNACHDFTAPVQPAVTPRMKVAMHMWNDFVRTRTISGDAPVFCDSCHHGSLTFLDRRDRPALEHWMDESFVKTLAIAPSGAEQVKGERCETCHGTPPKWKLIDAWRK